MKTLLPFFASTKLPIEPIQLSQSETIVDCEKFVKSHISILQAQSGNKVFKPYYDRLRRLMEILTK